MLPSHLSALLMIGSLLSLIGCRGSTKEVPATVGELRAECQVEQLSDRRDGAPLEINRIHVVVRNAKGAAVENESVRVSVNGRPMRFHVWSGNYYDRHPSYRLEAEDGFAVQPDTEYTVDVTTADGIPHSVGSLKSPGNIAANQFVIPRSHPRDRELVISWREIHPRAELVVQWTPEPLSDNGEAVDDGKPLVDQSVKQKLGNGWFRSKTGALTIPASAFKQHDGRRPRSLTVTVRAENRGELAGTVSEKSTLEAVRMLTYHVELVDAVK